MNDSRNNLIIEANRKKEAESCQTRLLIQPKVERRPKIEYAKELYNESGSIGKGRCFLLTNNEELPMFEYTQKQRQNTAWQKAFIVQGSNPDSWRIDEYGNWIRYSEYGNRNSTYGWEVDHIVATALGGPDIPSNWRALHWRVNARLGGLLSASLNR